MLALLARVRARRGPRSRSGRASGMYVAGSMPVFVLVAVLWPGAGRRARRAVALAQSAHKPWDVRLGESRCCRASRSSTGLAAGAASRAGAGHDWLAVHGAGRRRATCSPASLNFALVAGLHAACCAAGASR